MGGRGFGLTIPAPGEMPKGAETRTVSSAVEDPSLRTGDSAYGPSE